MRIGAVAFLSVLLAMTAACGHRRSSGTVDDQRERETATAGPSTSTTVDPSGPTLERARARWKAAVDRLTAAGSARYSWSSTLDGLPEPVEVETGTFAFDPAAAAYERTINSPTESGPTHRTHVQALRPAADTCPARR